ncbi:hypothetical protein RhiJN_02150 [Ceratobasidium sp. AG-Ba]|nr:hypothetical protein RhiJN_02150 [Ceratobasidium sp. AG-Ba]QRW03082.1 hypothetical protein RhiLY_02081 [Ceratobasidium sp. AG-Ba]
MIRAQACFNFASTGYVAKLNPPTLYDHSPANCTIGMASVRPRWGSSLGPSWSLGDYLNPLSMNTGSSRSDSPGLDALTISKLLWSDDDDEDEDEVEDHILTGNTTLVSGTWRASDDGTDNPDEAEVDGLIDTFDVELPEHSFRRISSWRAGVVWTARYDLTNPSPVISPLPAHRKRKRSSSINRSALHVILLLSLERTFKGMAEGPKHQKHVGRQAVMRLNDPEPL